MMVSTSELSDLEDFKSLIKTSDESQTQVQVTIDSLLSRVTCDNESCQLGLEDCEDCGNGMGKLKMDLNTIFEKKKIQTVKYQQWMFTDQDQKPESKNVRLILIRSQKICVGELIIAPRRGWAG